jgi:hypothetical protein
MEHREGAVVLQATVKVSANTYHTVRHLCAERPPDPNRKLEYAISVPPLARTILDSVFNVAFLLEDFPDRIAWYLRSGWREAFEEHQRYAATYGGSPEWVDILAGWSQRLENTRASWYVAELEAQDPSCINWWPTPGQMLRGGHLSEDLQAYLQYLNDWFYRILSSDSHLALPGLMRRSVHLLYTDDREERDMNLDSYRSNCFVATVIVFVALLSELQIGLGYDLAERCRYLWTILGDSFPPAKEIYHLRYESRL